MSAALSRADAFCKRFGLRLPILLAPMAGACPVALSAAVANTGGLGACGALLLPPAQIAQWAHDFRAQSDGAFQINLWIPDPPPVRDARQEEAVRAFLGQWGGAIDPHAGDAPLLDFDAQCEAILDARPAVVSSIMGLYPAHLVDRFAHAGIDWFASVSTLAEARAAAAAGAAALIVQGVEAGGHRAAFDAHKAEAQAAGLFALLPVVADAVSIPIVAAGGIADGRGAAAAMLLGASAVQIGTGFLRAAESSVSQAWQDALAHTPPEATMITRAFSGRPGRAIANGFARAFAQPDAPRAAPYPVQRGLTTTLRNDATRNDDIERMQAWAGQSAMLARTGHAADIATDLWRQAKSLLEGGSPS